MKSTVFFGITNLNVLRNPELKGVLPEINPIDLRDLLTDTGDLDHIEKAELTSGNTDTPIYVRENLIRKAFAGSPFEVCPGMINHFGYNLLPVTIPVKKAIEKELEKLKNKKEIIQHSIEKYESLVGKRNVNVEEFIDTKKKVLYMKWDNEYKENYSGLISDVLVLSEEIPENIHEPNDLISVDSGNGSITYINDLTGDLNTLIALADNKKLDGVTIYILVDVMGECGNY